MSITEITTKPEGFGPRIVRTVKPEYVERGNFNPGQDRPHEIDTPHMARILLSANNPRKGEEDYHGNRLRELRDILRGETVSTFYAEYHVHPDDAEKGLALAATL